MLNTTNKKTAVVLFFVSIIYLIASFKLPSYAYVPIDSNVIPIGLGVILLILSIALFFIKDEKTGEKVKLPKEDLIAILVVVGFILIYIFLLEIIGFILITALFIFFCSWFLGFKKYITNAIVSIVLPFAIYYLFEALQIQLPQGILPF
ncbi:tripartite tricarboxylate transporter TctB family protein [Neobacillus mesonae]|uniref:tripartite tricarboxylate transporter TctB family protein n=1 Tax=Neobacillus mesonae TaxID=1193713 RepID=UPI00204184CB|nr:tripartite tricarboxylate transporter TctB family protein [Neobacillus mesonae]MCM3570378.1 tripartite tricarboxylate transporter TctB family protein [Neobacillus mesonae]